MKFIKQTIPTYLIAFLIAFFLTSCGSDPSKKIKKENIETAKERINSDFDYPTIDFDKSNHDFGEIIDGEIVETTFTFTNSGNSDLKIFGGIVFHTAISLSASRNSSVHSHPASVAQLLSSSQQRNSCPPPGTLQWCAF